MNAMASRFQPVITLPFDVRLMNATSVLLLIAVLLGAGAAGLWQWLRNPAFAIERIVVSGQTEHNDEASLREHVLPYLNGNFFTLDLGRTQVAFQSAPWVERAVIWRRWPGLLNVTLQEHQPYARWGASGERMMDVNGQLFDTGSGGASGLEASAWPTLIGPDARAELVLATYRKLAPLVPSLGTKTHTRLAALQLQDRGNWRALLADEGAPGEALNALIELGAGTPDELAARLQTFTATAPDVAARHQRAVTDIKTADLGYPNGYALRLKGVGTTDGQRAATAARR
jgi:cell division protein FtsQ